jgi:hypothetical protein
MNPINKQMRTTRRDMRSIVDLEEHLHMMLKINREKKRELEKKKSILCKV